MKLLLLILILYLPPFEELFLIFLGLTQVYVKLSGNNPEKKDNIFSNKLNISLSLNIPE